VAENEAQGSDVKITVRPNGPLRVEGRIRLLDANGDEWDLTSKPAFSLCRCGHSANKPFCDGTHAKIGFESTPTAPPRANADQPS
jgi:CDGSH-type Zn-finger protein